MITEDDCLRVLGEPFNRGDWILFGDPGHESLCRAVHGKGMAVLLIEQDDLADACKAYALKHGVRSFREFEEVKKFLAWDGNAHVEETEGPNKLVLPPPERVGRP